MIDTTIAAAYAAQYARKSGIEPFTNYYCPNVGSAYTYLAFDDLSCFLTDISQTADENMKKRLNNFSWELRVYDDAPSVLISFPNHAPHGDRIVNKIPYCSSLEFKDSKKSTEVNFRNVVLAAKELVRRYDYCKCIIEGVKEKFKKLPEGGELTILYADNEKEFRRIANKYDYSYERVDFEQIKRVLKIFDKFDFSIGKPFKKVGANYARHLFENVLNLCSDVNDAYLSTDSFGVAASIYVEDKFNSDLLKDGLQLPEIFETLAYFDRHDYKQE